MAVRLVPGGRGIARRCRRILCHRPSGILAASAAGHDDGGACQKNEDRRAPEHICPRRDRRVEQHIVAIGVPQIGQNFGVAGTRRKLPPDLDPKIARQIGVGIIDRLVLADKAAKLFRQYARPFLQRRISQHFLRRDGDSRRRGRHNHRKCCHTPQYADDSRQPHGFVPAARSRMAGRNSSSSTRRSIGPAWRRMMVPLASTRKVSGTP